MNTHLYAWRQPRARQLRGRGAAGALLAVTALLVPVAAHAADPWPTHPLRMVVPFAPGGTTDLIGRMVAEGLSRALGQPVVVENKAGAGGNLGAADVARAPPDGYTLMMGTPGPLAINRFVYANTPFQDDKDFAAVSYVADVPNVILANPATGFRNVEDMLAAARARPGQLNWGSPGVGSTGHIALEMLKQQAKVDIVHVPYKGASQATADLLGGQIQLSGDNVPTALPNVRSGKLVALGVMGDRELPALPGVAPVNATVPGYSLNSWFVVVAPAGTPKAIIDRTSAVIDAYIKQPEVAAKLRELGAIPVGGPPERLAEHLKVEQARFREVIARTNLKPE
jgi:tripartite-type tricarboxylate transporter receptor subunit TctC